MIFGRKETATQEMSRSVGGVWKGLTMLALAGLFLLAAAAITAQEGNGATGGSAEPIAYVDGVTGDEIRLVQPDGSNDRRLWAHGTNDPQGELQVWSLSWRGDAGELAFAGTHEK